MSESEAAKVAGRLQKDGQHELDDVMRHLNSARTFLHIVMTGRTDPDEGRVAELERQLAAMTERAREAERRVTAANEDLVEELETTSQLKVQLAAAQDDRARDHEAYVGLEQLLATAYVAREVPWTDVAAGMMTIARDGTPWMVEQACDNGDVELRNAGTSFMKRPEAGETVRVLEPYVTPEQAEQLVREQLGGRA